MIEYMLDKDISRRLFGKSELNIIRKQIKGLKLTQSERNRLSRDIRPKFKAIQQFSFYSDEFDLKFDQNYKIIKDEIIKHVKEHELFPNVLAIILFGSHADKSYNIFSDLDFAVIMKDGTPKDFFDFRIEILANFDSGIDFVVYNELPPKIKNSIRKNYKILYKKSRLNIIDYL